MNLYLDASALVKRYVAEDGSDAVRDAMEHADAWITCRVAFVETTRAVGIAAGAAVAASFRAEWPAFAVVEVDDPLARRAATLAVERDLRSLDALHLAAGLLVARTDPVFATWDRRLHGAARAEGLAVLPADLPRD